LVKVDQIQKTNIIFSRCEIQQMLNNTTNAVQVF